MISSSIPLGDNYTSGTGETYKPTEVFTKFLAD
jgi:hypothetical protein